VRAVAQTIREEDLQAWVDGRLTREQIDAVENYFAAHPDEWDRWSQYADQRQALRAAFVEKAAESIPGRLRVAHLLSERRRRVYRNIARVAAAVGLVIAGGAGGWTAHDALPFFLSSGSAQLASTVFDDAIAAHRTFSVETRHPVEVGANEETHLVQWLSKRLGHRLIAPDLGSLGFELMGGRLLSADSGPAALFMYEDGKGTRLSCYYLPVASGEESEFQYREQNGVGAFYWVDDGLAYAIAANTNRALLLKIAELIYQQISTDGQRIKVRPEPGKPS
jgi:anti-sigma factor RsiW